MPIIGNSYLIVNKKEFLNKLKRTNILNVKVGMYNVSITLFEEGDHKFFGSTGRAVQGA